MHREISWTEKLVGAFVGYVVAVPSIAGGFYCLYRVVTALSNGDL